MIFNMNKVFTWFNFQNRILMRVKLRVVGMYVKIAGTVLSKLGHLILNYKATSENDVSSPNVIVAT